jgi:hypothetical protein
MNGYCRCIARALLAAMRRVAAVWVGTPLSCGSLPPTWTGSGASGRRFGREDTRRKAYAPDAVLGPLRRAGLP